MKRSIVTAIVTASIIPFIASAAVLSIAPASKNVTAGQAFTMSIVVSSPDQAINAVSGDVLYPVNKVKVISVSKAGSIVGLWVRDPSFANTTPSGDVHFEGVVLNPGWRGNNGTVLQVTFQAIAPGPAPITFTHGEVLANDGQGTSILTATNPGNVSVAVAPAPPPEPTSTPAQTSTSGLVVTPAPTQAPVSTIPPSVTVALWPSGEWENILAWVAIILLMLFAFALLVAIASYIYLRLADRNRGGAGKRVIEERKELHNDLVRIERELEEMPGVRGRKEREKIKREIEHIDEDIRHDR